MNIIQEEHFISSVADALQFISYYHPIDFIQAMHKAYLAEQSKSAKDAIAQILVNSRMSAEGHRPLCQDTGIVVGFVKIGAEARIDSKRPLQELFDEGIRRAYRSQLNPLRASIVTDPAGARKNTKDNTPGILHVEFVLGDKIEVSVAAKGGGSENKSKLEMLNPNDDIVGWVLETVPEMGAGWCPPGVLGIGIGGSAEKAMVLAKESLMAPVDIHELQARGARTRAEELRLELFEKVNQLGIGAQGLGGLSTVLDVKVLEYPTHAASLPVAMIPNCAATRHVHFELDGSGPAALTPPSLDDWPKISLSLGEGARRIDLSTVSRAEIATLKPGETVLLSGKILTGRDAAHKRIADILGRGEKLPDGVDFTNRFIYYVGPVDPVGGEVVGPAGPTTATRMDKYTDLMLSQTGLLGMIGKAERGPETVELIKKHKAVYLMAVGGAAYLVSKAITASRVVAFEDLGMEAIYEFEVKDMPVTVAVDSQGVSVHEVGPAEWRKKILKILPH
jgi:fumarate hydratase class I